MHEPRPYILNTFDCEEWWHVIPSPYPTEASRTPLFERSQALTLAYAEHCNARSLPCVFFVLGETARRSPQLVRYLTSLGFEIGSHSMTHPDLQTLDRSALVRELSDSKKLLEDLIGKPVRAFRAPNFSITRNNLWALDEVCAAGYTIDSSILIQSPSRPPSPGISPPSAPALIQHQSAAGILHILPCFRRPFLGMHVRFPGGGFLRLLPLTLLRKMLAAHPFHNLYIHASDFDRFRPRIQSDNLVQHFKRRVGSSTTHTKLFDLFGRGSVLSVDAYIHQATEHHALAHTHLDTLSALLPQFPQGPPT